MVAGRQTLYLLPATTVILQRHKWRRFRYVDFGPGKHYLTFALPQYLASRLKQLKITVVERRLDLMSLGRQVGSSLSIESLSFQEGTIAESELSNPTLVVALHACDTATDDALAKANRSGARYICVARAVTSTFALDSSLRRTFFPSSVTVS
jgi:hypothetical protein